MAQDRKDTVVECQVLDKTTARSLPLATKGIGSSRDLANLMGAMISDIIEGTITPQTCNAACNAAGKLLKICEMEHKYGTTGNDKKAKVLILSEKVG